MILTQLQLYHREQCCSFEWKQTVLVDWHHQWHWLSFQSVQGSHSLAYPYLLKCYQYLWLVVILMIPTSKANICFWWIISTQDFGKVNLLESDFSIDFGFVPLNCIIQVIWQLAMFLDYLTIKFGEYCHQRDCGGVIYWSYTTSSS